MDPKELPGSLVELIRIFRSSPRLLNKSSGATAGAECAACAGPPCLATLGILCHDLELRAARRTELEPVSPSRDFD